MKNCRILLGSSVALYSAPTLFRQTNYRPFPLKQEGNTYENTKKEPSQKGRLFKHLKRKNLSRLNASRYTAFAKHLSTPRRSENFHYIGLRTAVFAKSLLVLQ